ncbi:MAG: HAD family phosphatase [Candidatus Amulumruptor caecigallinarius]|nr:HAD family phosphatase [Candidatus Amulumruptor caecigallinarius]
MNNIKNIIVDLGGVVIDLDRERCVRAYERLGMKDADSRLGLYRQGEPFLGVEVGRLTAGEFFDTLRTLTGSTGSDAELEQAFLSFLADLPVERLRALREAKRRGFRLFMLSNTNAIMYNGWIRRRFEAEGLKVEDYFDGIVTSFGEGCCKPDPEIFRRVLHRYALRPEQTVMLDDSEANCRGAESVGMRSLRITKDTDLIRALAQIEHPYETYS